MTLEPGWEKRVDAAIEAAFPSSPLNILARTINRLAELLPKGHECERIFREFDNLGDYVRSLEEQIDHQNRKEVTAMMNHRVILTFTTNDRLAAERAVGDVMQAAARVEDAGASAVRVREETRHDEHDFSDVLPTNDGDEA